MIPVFASAGVLTAPLAPLMSSGYVPGNTLAAQHLNWYLYHLTAEINNVLAGQGLSQLTTDDSQLLKAVGRTNVLVSTSGTVTVASQFAGNTLTQFNNSSGSSNYVIGSGAARPGVELIVEALSGSGVMIVNGSGSAFLGSGAVRLLWDGSQWCKIGGNAFAQVFTSGSGISWFTPWKGSYKVTAVGGGGGGGAIKGASSAGGGGGGGVCIKTLAEAALSILTYVIGSLGSGGASGAFNAGSAGTNTTLSDGTSTLVAGGGGGGSSINGAGATGGSGGTSSGGDINSAGSPGGFGYNSAAIGIGGNGGSSLFASGAKSIVILSGSVAGNSSPNYGGGGSGAGYFSGAVDQAGGNGSAGLIVVEF